MKKILIFSHALELGGAERSLIGLLGAIDKSEYRVDLFLMRHTGELMKYIPEGVNLLPEIPEYTVPARPMATTLREGYVRLTLGRLRGKLAARRYDKKHLCSDSIVELDYSHKYIRKLMPPIEPETEYDLAISFLTPHYLAREKVRAKKYLAWIHTDYTRVGIDTDSELAMWGAYDYIASISDSVKEGFSKVFPSLSDKLVQIGNILPTDIVRADAEDDVSDEMGAGRIKLLSVGRFCNAKNFDNVPFICRRLNKAGLDVTWYLIGFGGDEALIREKIAEAGMEKRVIILGKKENPYPYIASCDLYVQPSRYEGKAVTVREAQMLGKSVVIAEYATSASQLEDGVDGVIVPQDNDGCADGIAALLRDPGKMEMLMENCRARDYSDAAEVERIYEIMKG